MAKLEFDGKLNLLALTSFILSVIALTNQFLGYVKGAQVELLPPQTVVIRAVTYPSIPNSDFLVMEAPLTYTNVGAVGYNAIVRNKDSSFMIADRPRKHVAFIHFVDVDDRKTSLTTEPEYRGVEAAGPKVVPAQGALTHWTSFIPKNIVCDAEPSTKCDALANSVPMTEENRQSLKSSSRIDLTFSVEVVGRKLRKSVSCWINGTYIDPTIREKHFSSLDCNPYEQHPLRPWWAFWR
jgi:hypothetical protein